MSGPALRILVLGVNFAPESTGIAPYTTGLARGLAERGHDVRVITSFPHYPDWRVVRIPEQRPGQPGWPAVMRVRHYVPARPTGLRRLAFEISFGVRLATIRWMRPDVVICVSPALFGSALAVRRARLSRNRPAIGVIVQDLYSHGVVETGVGGSRLAGMMRSFESRVLRSAEGVSVIHPRFRTSVVDGLGVAPNRVAVIRNWTHVRPAPPFDESEFRASLGWLPSQLVVLYTGAMGVKQALENVVEAARLADSQEPGVLFVLLGNGSQRDQLVELAAGVRSIRFMDNLNDASYAKALRAADVLLVNELPGVSDMAVPSKLTSYFSAGRPVVAATERASATAEELGRAGAGMVVPPGDPRALLSAVASMARSPDSKRHGEAGVRYSSTVLSERHAVDAYDAWVRVLHAERPRKRD